MHRATEAALNGKLAGAKFCRGDIHTLNLSHAHHDLLVYYAKHYLQFFIPSFPNSVWAATWVPSSVA